MANVIQTVTAPCALDWEVFIRPFIDEPSFKNLPFDFIFGKFVSMDLYFNTQLDKIATKKIVCGWTFSGSSAFTKKTITPVEIDTSVKQCYDTLVNTIFAQGLPDGWQRGELSREVIDYMLSQRTYAANRDLLTILMLGDTANAVPYYAIANGMYKKLAAGALAGDGTVDAGPLTATSLNTTNFLTTMNAVWDARTRLMRGMEKSRLVWIWTESVFSAYVKYLQSQTQNSAGIIQSDFVTDGVTPSKFNGVPIVVVPIVDERLEADFNTGSPLAVVDPYRVILTDPQNHKILIDGNGLVMVNQWYERKDDTYYMTSSMLFAYEYGYGELNVIAGF